MSQDGKPMQVLTGLGVSEGIGIGGAVCLERSTDDVFRFPVAEQDVDHEVGRLHEAVEQVSRDVSKLEGEVGDDLGEQFGSIFNAHALLLSDSSFLDPIIQRIRDEHVNAEWAVHRAAEELAERFAKIEDEYLRERQSDVRDVAHHLIHSLQGIDHHDISEIEGPVAIVADDLTPSEAVRFGREGIVGIAIEGGGRTSHTSIIARSLKIPAVTGLGSITDRLDDEEPIIIDGIEGKVILHPLPEVLAEYRLRRRAQAERELDLLATRDLTATTRDGIEIQLMVNIDLLEELNDARLFGASGVGLYRSEFLYIERDPALPTEEDHVEIYRRLVRESAPYPAVIRTYDLGGRKLSRELLQTEEANPVLGLRGIRLTMARKDIFRIQLRALFRAAVEGDLWVMIPLVSTVDEVREFRAFAEEIRAELEAEGIEHRADLKIGIMIEVPSAAAIADLLAHEVDFFSVGTNDLIQYSMAVDRNNENVAKLYQPLHPGILRMLRFIVDSARAAEIPLSLCGEMAADPRHAALLVGLGFRRLSASPRNIPAIKTCLRSLSVEQLAESVNECLGLATAAEVRDHLDRLLELGTEGSSDEQAGELLDDTNDLAASESLIRSAER